MKATDLTLQRAASGLTVAPKVRKRTVRTPSTQAAEQMGIRIRAARLELGVTLATLAGSDLSRAFVNQIELGRARPSMRTLQMIAERLQRPVEYFLQDPEVSATALELALTESETRIRQGDLARAESLMTGLVSRSNIPADVRMRAQLILAEVRLRLGQVEVALPLLHEARCSAETRKALAITVEIYDRIGSAHYLLRQMSEASRWFEKALSTYVSAKVIEPLLKARILGHRANMHYVAGQPQDAVQAYQAAIAAAEGVLDMQGLAGIYEGLAMSYQQAGQGERALNYAQRSLRLFESLQDVRMSAQLRNNMAEILLEQGQTAEAERLFIEGAGQLQQVGDRDARPHLLAGAAEAALAQGKLDEARARIEAALAAAEQSNDPLSRMVAERVSGRVAHALGYEAESRIHFERALQLAASADSVVASSRVAYDYARMLEECGEHQEASLHYRQAYERRSS